ncbi:MAG: DUF4174 domain-containing protein [Desulfobacterales bacterium]|nr:DUF4174 domain-containing protein [Desulfobacterales bacterium]
MDLSQFQWKHRILFLFAPDASHPNLIRLQNEIAQQTDAINERDLVIFEIVEKGIRRMDAAPLNRQTAVSIRDHFAVSPKAFTVILVGKDGGVKLRRDEYVGLAAVFGLIDSMPMRKNEMQQRKQ